jgi:hypothetical protein
LASFGIEPVPVFVHGTNSKPFSPTEIVSTASWTIFLYDNSISAGFQMTSDTHACSATTWGSPGASKTAVLIHGLASSSQTWVDVAPELVKKGLQITFDELFLHI